MNEDGTPIQGEESNERPAGQVEGGGAEPKSDDIAKMYDDLGIKAPVPTDAAKRRSKTSKVRTEDDKKKDSGSADNDSRSKGGRSSEDADDKGKSKNAPDSDKDGDSGDAANKKASKNGSEDGKVQDKSEEAGEGVRKDKSESEEDSERGSEDGSDGSDKRSGQEAHEQGGSEEEGEDDGQGKRPGKSNPEVEKRFQKITAESKAKDTRIEQLEKQLRETTQKQRESQIATEDPEYTVADFKKVRDNDTGEVLELTDDQAELAHRRWKDGYEQRKAERSAEQNREEAIEEYKREAEQTLMKSSAEAYDTLTDILDKFPELKVDSGKFDKEFSGKVMPLIEDMIIYQKGTEPGNEAGKQPVIIGMSMNPTKMLQVINEIKSQKRNLPLNGTHDTVETRSDVSVPHSRSSDQVVNQANELYKTLGINKRIK